MVANLQVEETSEVIASSLQYIYNSDVAPEFEVTAESWRQAVPILTEVVKTTNQLNAVLGDVQELLLHKQEATLRSSIVITQSDHTMVPLVARDSQTGHFAFEAYLQFRYGDKPYGIAGLSANLKKSIVSTDVSDITNPVNIYWIPSTTFEAGGILAIPILTGFPESGLEKDCIAVLSVASRETNFFCESDLCKLDGIAERIKTILLQSKILPKTDTFPQRAVDPLSAELYNTAMKERGGGNSQQTGAYHETNLAKLLENLRDERNHNREPWQAIQILETLEAAGESGVDADHLLPFINSRDEGSRRLSSIISNLNSRFLKKIKLRIQGKIRYQLVKDS